MKGRVRFGGGALSNDAIWLVAGITPVTSSCRVSLFEGCFEGLERRCSRKGSFAMADRHGTKLRIALCHPDLGIGELCS